MESFYIAVGWAIIGSKLAALFALIFFAKQSAKLMVFGKPSNDWREQVEHSLLIVAVVSFGFHFLGRFISDAILSAEIDKMTKRHLYYLFFAFYEVIYVTLIIKLHQFRNCIFARFSRYVCYLSAAMSLLILIRYVDRVFIQADFLKSSYQLLVATINITTLFAISAYPAFRLFSLVPTRRWV
ncbi:hypothetical protein [Pseudoalteromonas phenolica]|uniref:hypothetical protein n=1 Tax=Pseudoalteromonas phenolica TaxID=161398 RepID=UPI00110A5359|nr:hypothetical protein [Pseudoalteromonas phenolica]TMO54110.1 hypothetical protein CWC21_16625 [Pseudoalteromonas phenolica]